MRKSEGKKPRVAAYCRVSTGSEEQHSSYEAQIRYYEQHIKEHPDYMFAGIYADQGISGTDQKKRDAFKRLMQDCRDGHIDRILTKSLSRFGRNTLDSLKSIRELKALGVDVYFEKENIHTMKHEGELLITLISAVAQNESLALSENVKWGIRRKYERGQVQSIPSGKFLGYDKDKTGHLVINEEQAVIVRRIYREFLDGYGTYQIAERLTSEKVPMAHGGKGWCADHIRKVLTNEKMMGDTRFQKTYNVDYLTKKRAKNNGELPQHYLKDTHPAIIEKETWEIVQLELDRQARFANDHGLNRFHHHTEEYPLSGKIICSVCGHSYMVLESKKKDEDGWRYWRCRSFLGRRGTEIEGKTVLVLPSRPRTSTNPGVISRRKDPKSRPMLCTDIQVGADVPIQAFIKAWNHLVDNKEHYKQELQENITGGDKLRAYRAKELIYLIEETGHIETMSYELMLKTLEHIEIWLDGNQEVIFLAGTRIKV